MPMNCQVIAPDWVMLGVQAPDGVLVYASTDLTRAELEAKINRPGLFNLWEQDRFQAPPTVIEMQATMGSFVVAVGADYTEALRTLFEHWSPEDGDRRDPTHEQPSIEPTPLALPPAPCPTCEGSRSVGEPGFTHYGVPEPGSYEACPDCMDEHGIPTGLASPPTTRSTL